MDSEEKNLDMADPSTDPEPQKPVVQVRKAKKRKSSRVKRKISFVMRRKSRIMLWL